MHVDSREAGAIESRCHFHLTVDALLTQYGNLRTHVLLDVRRADVVVDVKAELDRQAWVFFVQQGIEFLLGAFGVVAQLLDLVAGFCPLALQQTALIAEHSLAIEADGHVAAVDRLTDDRHAVAQTSRAELRQHFRGGVLADLDHRAQFFVEQYGVDLGTVVGQGIEVQVQTAVAGEGHFQSSDQQAAVGTVVVSQQHVVGIQALDHGEERLEVFSVVDIRRLTTEQAVGLRQDRGAHAVLPAAEVDQDQVGFALVQTQLWRQGLAYIDHRGEAGHDQRHRRGHALVLALILPAGLHRHRVLAHRNGDAKGRAQFHADGFYGVVQTGVFTRMTSSSHPVGRQFDVGNFLDARGGDVGQRLANRHAPGRGSVEQSQRRALTHGHGFTAVHVEAGVGHGAVSHRHLPRADHLITGH